MQFTIIASALATATTALGMAHITPTLPGGEIAMRSAAPTTLVTSTLSIVPGKPFPGLHPPAFDDKIANASALIEAVTESQVEVPLSVAATATATTFEDVEATMITGEAEADATPSDDAE